jgi:hypothetical protein
MTLGARWAAGGAVVACLLGLLAPERQPLQAQTGDGGTIPDTVTGAGWSPARRIPDTVDRIGTPLLLADRDRTVYALVSEDVGNGKQIFIRKWRLDEGWTAAVDVSPPAVNAQICGAFLGADGTLHLAYYALAPGRGPEIFYSQANAQVADRAAAWSPPESVGSGVIEPFCTLQGDDHGHLVIVSNSNAYGNSLVAVSSPDGGRTWTPPESRFTAESLDTYPGPVRGTVDDRGNVHLVWSVWRPPTGGEAVYYAQLDAATRTWREPLLLLSKQQTGTNTDWPSVTFYDDELLVFIQADMGKLAQHMVRSIDAGQTWTAPERAFPGVYGGHGHAVSMVDGAGTLHAVLCNRTEDTLMHGSWHSLWRNGTWTPVESVVTGPKSPLFDPTLPEAVVVQGNLLFMAWHMDGAPGAFYAYKVLDGVPELPITPVPPPATVPPLETPEAMPTPDPTAVSTALPPETEVPRSVIEAPMTAPPSPMIAVLVGTVAAAIAIGVFLLVRPTSG